MPTPRCYSSVVTYNEWLIVAGGMDNMPVRGCCKRELSSVDVMNIDTKQWYSGPPSPTRFSSWTAALVGDMCYYTESDVYRVSLPALISQVKSRNMDSQIWEKISSLNVSDSTPLSIGGSLLALGGRSHGSSVTSIQHYQPENNEWIQVGDLPSPHCNFTCAVINDGDVLVAGGYDNYDELGSYSYISFM